MTALWRAVILGRIEELREIRESCLLKGNLNERLEELHTVLDMIERSEMAQSQTVSGAISAEGRA